MYISIFDLNPDIEGLIVKELGVLLRFRACVHEFKALIHNPEVLPRSLSPNISRIDLYMLELLEKKYPICIQRAWSILRTHRRFDIGRCKYRLPYPNIHGLVCHTNSTYEYIHGYQSHYQQQDIRCSLDACTVQQLDHALRSLGVVPRRAKNKREKISLLLRY